MCPTHYLPGHRREGTPTGSGLAARLQRQIRQLAWAELPMRTGFPWRTVASGSDENRHEPPDSYASSRSTRADRCRSRGRAARDERELPDGVRRRGRPCRAGRSAGGALSTARVGRSRVGPSHGSKASASSRPTTTTTPAKTHGAPCVIRSSGQRQEHRRRGRRDMTAERFLDHVPQCEHRRAAGGGAGRLPGLPMPAWRRARARTQLATP